MTMQLKKRKRTDSPKAPTIKDIKIQDEVYDLVDYFYPRPDFMQVLQLYMRPEDIMNIMNYNEAEAITLYKEIRSYFGDESQSLRVLIPHFCHYMQVDELFIHLFLASLKKHPISNPKKKINETEPVNSSPVNGQLLKLAQIIENLQKGIRASPAILRERINEWNRLYPLGEPMYKRYDNYRVIIYTDEVAAVLKTHLRTAQELLKELREYFEMPPKSRVTIKKFCAYFHCEEEEVRKCIAAMYGEEYKE